MKSHHFKPLVSALIFGRRLAWLRRAWVAGAAHPIVCRDAGGELIRVRACPKFRLEDADRTALLAEYLPHAETARLPRPLSRVHVACRDRDDVVFIQSCLATSADLMVSGDMHLAELARRIPVASPASLAQRLGRNTET